MAAFLQELAVSFDFPILDWIRMHLACPALDFLMPLITRLGDAGIFFIALSLVFLAVPKYRKSGMAMLLALLMGLIVCNIMLKPLVARVRPYDLYFQLYGKEIPLLISRQHDFSFPSGHTIAAFEASVALLLNNRKYGSVLLIIGILVSFSRLYLYVHYVSDVLASMVLGIGLAFLANSISGKLTSKLNALLPGKYR